MNPCVLLLALAAGSGCVGPEPAPADTPAASAVEAGPGAVAGAIALVAADEPRTSAQPVAPDRWIAEDKVQHFAASFAATSMAYGGGRVVMEASVARGSAAALAIALGIGKELADLRRGSRFSLKDLAWDAAGVTLGVIFAHRIH